MFFFERLVGMLVYVAATIAVYWLVSRQKSLKGRRIILFLYLIIVSAMAYFYIPYETADVYRLVEYMNIYATMSSGDFLLALGESGIPATLVYYRLIGSLGYPGLLSAITAFIVFLNIFYVIYDYSKKHNDSSKAVAVSLITIMSTGIYMQTIGNIRTMLAFSIIARCFYDETVNNKSVYKNILWYLIACLVHPVAIVATVLRLGVYVWSNLRRRNTRAVLLSAISLPILIYFAFRFGGERFLENITEKAEGYINDITYTYLWDNIITILTILLILISYSLYRYYSREKNKLDRVIEFSLLLLVLSLFFIFEHATFVRFTQLNLLIMIPIIMYNVSSILSSPPSKSTKIMYRVYGLIVITIFFVSATRGALSSLKFFVLT